VSEAGMFIGAAPKGCKERTLIVVTRTYRSKWWRVVCLGQKSHYRPDGSCVHTDELLARWKRCPVDRVKVDHGWEEQERQKRERAVSSGRGE
jgi:hypothetical protein